MTHSSHSCRFASDEQIGSYTIPDLEACHRLHSLTHRMHRLLRQFHLARPCTVALYQALVSLLHRRANTPVLHKLPEESNRALLHALITHN